MITPECFAKIKDVDIAQVVGHYVKLTKDKACCPFHNEKSPSFSVNRKKQIYKCFGCGEAGDGLQFVMKYERLEFFGAIEAIADIGMIQLEFDRSVDVEAYKKRRADQATKRQILREITDLYKSKLWDPECEVMAQLTGKRLWTPETIGLWELGYAPDQWRLITPMLAEKGMLDAAGDIGLVTIKDTGNNFDTFKNRIIFPIHNEFGEVIGMGGRVKDDGKPKYINSCDSDLYSKSKVLYGLYQSKKGIEEKGFAILVEGYADVISFHQAGMNNTVCSGGTAFTAEQARILRRYTEPHHRVTVIPDNDTREDGTKPGIDAAMRTLEVLWAHDFKAKIMIIPQDEKGKKVDPDDLARKYFNYEEEEQEDITEPSEELTV